MKVLILISLAALAAAASQGGERVQLQEDYGYVEVRPGAHMFWVMYHVDQPGNYTDFPLIMWLQGGPGASGVGYGNFMELGPYDINGNLREYAWTKRANVMFVDNPVGAGYSYVDDPSQLTTNNSMIADDLVTLVKTVFTANPDMQVMPFWVFAESYGGKMTVDFALAFDEAIKNGEIVSDFRGVALGDSWISPMDFVNTWGTFLYQMGFVNQQGLQNIDAAAADTQAAVDAGLWVEATNKWSYTELVVMINANNVNFYNVLAEEDIYRNKKQTSSPDLSFMSPEIRRLYDNHVAYQTRDALGDFMNGPQADAWGIPAGVVWDSQGGMVFDTLAGDFMKPVIDSVVKLLTQTTLDVVVFTGNLDLICDTPGTYLWMENMEWPDKPNFMAADNAPIYITAYSSTAATIQQSGQLSLYTILRSGHMVPIDAPEMSVKMLDMIFANSKKRKAQQEPAKQEEVSKTKPAEEAPKKEAVKQEEQPKQEVPKQEAPTQHDKPIAVKLADLKKQAFKEEAEKEEAAKQKEAESKEEEETKQEEHKKEAESEEEEETKQEEHKKEAPKKNEEEHKQEKKQKIPQKKEAPKKQTNQEHNHEDKEEEQKKAPILKKIKEKVVKQVKKKQEKAHKQEQKHEAPKQKKEAPKQEQKQEKEAPKQKVPKQEAKKDGPVKDLNKLKANIMASKEQHKQQRDHQRRHSPFPDPRRMKR